LTLKKHLVIFLLSIHKEHKVGSISIIILAVVFSILLLFVSISVSRLIRKRIARKRYNNSSVLPESSPNREGSVPKILHRIWIGPRVFPPYKDLRNMHSFDSLNEAFLRVVWKEEDIRLLIKKHYPEYESIYRGYRLNIQRADLARYLVLYEYGGVYADLDVSAVRPLGELLAAQPDKRFLCFVEIVLPEERANAIGEGEPIRKTGKQMGFGEIPEDCERIASYLVACAPKHPVMLKILEEVKRRSVLKVKRQYDVFYTTGPDLFTTVVHRCLKEDPDIMTVDKVTADGFFIHHGSALWKTFVNFPFR
jgi:mannosyltransferase OCH1-like enzyme